jgi:hypothetical protein
MWWAELLNTILGAFSSGVAASTASYESIASATGTGASGSITFSSIPSTYTHLQIRGLGKTDSSSLSSNFGIRINGDTASNYVSHRLTGNGTAASAAGSTGGSYVIVSNAIAGSSTSPSMTNRLGAVIFDILDYNSTTKNKTINGFIGVDGNTASTSLTVNLFSGLWLSTSAINSITIFAVDNYTTQSTFALYGIKG